MNIHKIRTEAECRAALKEASALVDSDLAMETPEGKRLNALVWTRAGLLSNSVLSNSAQN